MSDETMGFLGLAGVVLGLIFAARRDRRDKERDQRESTERLEAIRAGQLATLAAHVLHRGKIVELAVVNQGPGPAVLMSVEALGHPDLFMGSQTFGDQLLQGDKHVLLVALSLAHPRQMTIRITWTDERGEQLRDQTLDF